MSFVIVICFSSSSSFLSFAVFPVQDNLSIQPKPQCFQLQVICVSLISFWTFSSFAFVSLESDTQMRIKKRMSYHGTFPCRTRAKADGVFCLWNPDQITEYYQLVEAEEYDQQYNLLQILVNVNKPMSSTYCWNKFFFFYWLLIVNKMF